MRPDGISEQILDGSDEIIGEASPSVACRGDEMKIEDDGTIVFLSTPSNWWRERGGDKAYTMRTISDPGEWSAFATWTDFCRAKKIRIVSTGSEKSFTREVTDVTIAGEVLGTHFIGIGWRHVEGDGR